MKTGKMFQTLVSDSENMSKKSDKDNNSMKEGSNTFRNK